MKHVVGVAEMMVSASPEDVLVTHALGSCLGIAAWDARMHVGGLVHVMLPLSKLNPDKARDNPCMFVDTAVPTLFEAMESAGARRSQLKLWVAGGAQVNTCAHDRFAIGKRNFVVLKKLLWKNGVLISGEDVGGSCPRTMHFEVGTGHVWISSGGKQWDL